MRHFSTAIAEVKRYPGLSKDSLISRLTLECASRQIAPPNTVGSELFAGARRRLGQLDEYRRSLHRRPGLSEHRPAQARGEQRSFSNIDSY